MQKILIISTGGTFNKVYNPLNGTLTIDKTSQALKELASRWLCEFETKNIIGKDSLDMRDKDRAKLLKTIEHSSYQHIIIIHGTDTMDLTAQYLFAAKLKKYIILTGAMVPFSIDPVEATANLCSAYGYMNALNAHGVYIAMNGVLGRYNNIIKDRIKGQFYSRQECPHHKSTDDYLQ